MQDGYDKYSDDTFGYKSVSGISLYADDEGEESEVGGAFSPVLESLSPPEPEVEPVALEPETPKEPEVKENTLIVGNLSLARKDSPHAQQENMLNYLIQQALSENASAIHIEPQGPLLRIRMRIDGVLHQKTSLPVSMGAPMVTRLKEICALHLEDKIPQRNRVQASFNDKEMLLTVATYAGISGETLVLNIRQKQGGTRLLRLEQVGFSPLNLWRVKKSLGQQGGIVIVTGPARVGKTTTLYSLMNSQNGLTKSISTAESPVEQVLPGINQGNWTPESGLTFPEMIQSMAFLDPDLLMVSQLDSPETLNTCIELALKGIKVLTSYPSFDTMGALLRLNAQGLENYLVASSHLTLVSQRLVRQLCPHCKEESTPQAEVLPLLGLTESGFTEHKLFQPKGCEHCQHKGYLGQTAIHEVLTLNDQMREALLGQVSAARIRELARQDARLVSMVEDGYSKCVAGMTSLAEIQRVAFVNEYDSRHPRSADEILKMCKAEDKSGL